MVCVHLVTNARLPRLTLTINQTVSVIATIAIRALTFVPSVQADLRKHQIVVRTLDYLQVSNVVLSLLTNITATLIISHKTW